MATRLNKRQAESTVEKIRTTQLIKRLQDHTLGVIELTTSQIRAAEILLNKTLPNLKATELSGEVTNINYDLAVMGVLDGDSVEAGDAKGPDDTTH